MKQLMRRSVVTEELCNAGRNMSYNESVQVPNLFAAVILSALMSLGGILAYFSFTRNLIYKVVPAPGTGVTREQMESGHWELALIGGGLAAHHVHQCAFCQIHHWACFFRQLNGRP